MNIVLEKFEKAKAKHDVWRGEWQECYDYTLPQRNSFGGGFSPAHRRTERLYDGTALDAVDQLASLILGNITPPLTPWFGLKAGTDISEEDAKKLNPVLEKTSRLIQSHFDQSNFTVEIHQCILDLVVAGTASLLCHEAEPGELSALHFKAIPLSEIMLDEGVNGNLENVFRTLSLTPLQLKNRFPDVIFTPDKNDEKILLLESVTPSENGRHYTLTLTHQDTGEVIYETNIDASPYINFRWMKSPGEIYGRSPVMKTLPDIKTANKVVELILKNASISVTGIWQAEDDGVLNLNNIELVPGAIIPKAVGSKGLIPLEMPARFDVSQLILSDLRARIRHALLVDRLPQIGGGKATATEVAIRSEEMTLLLGATFGRLQVELLNPLIRRAYNILRERGAIPDLPLDGRTVAIDHRSPLARAQSSRNVELALGWMRTAGSMGKEITDTINHQAFLSYITEMLGIPDFINQPKGE